MLARAYRFHGHGSLRYVYACGQVIRGPYSVLRFAQNSRRKQWRVAVVVSRKVHKSAVVRNRIRRRIYEIIRNAIPKDAPAIDMVFIVHAAQVADIPALQLRRAIEEQLIKAGINLKPHDIVDKKE